jgi:hypothetical protein
MATLNQSEPWLCIGHYSIMQKKLDIRSPDLIMLYDLLLAVL